MPNNAKKNVYKEKEFDMYLLWKSLPAHFHGMKKTELESYNFTDPLILKIIKIKSQTEFAKYFHIKDLGTLTDWNHKIKKENLPSPLLLNTFNKKFTETNNKININNVKELIKKIEEQEEIITSLKMENEKYKNKQKNNKDSDAKIPQKNEGMLNKIKKVFRW
jgi:hypothetical protein